MIFPQTKFVQSYEKGDGTGRLLRDVMFSFFQGSVVLAT